MIGSWGSLRTWVVRQLTPLAWQLTPRVDQERIKRAEAVDRTLEVTAREVERRLLETEIEMWRKADGKHGDT